MAFEIDSVESIINEELLKKYTRIPKSRNHFSASQAGQCKRRVVLQRLGAKEDSPDLETCNRFFLGEALHEAIQKLIGARAEIVAIEKYVNDFGDPIVGRIDLLTRDGVVHSLYDLKFTGPGSFWTKIKKTKRPDPKHVFQLVTYFMINKKFTIDALKILYCTMDLKSKHTFEVTITPELIEEVKAYFRELQGFLHYRELPDVQATEELQKEFYCGNCQYRKHYCFPESDDHYVEIQYNINALIWPKEISTKETAAGSDKAPGVKEKV